MEKKKATQVTGCRVCKKGLSKNQWGMVIIGSYISGTSVYGTIEIIKLVYSLF